MNAELAWHRRSPGDPLRYASCPLGQRPGGNLIAVVKHVAG